MQISVKFGSNVHSLQVESSDSIENVREKILDLLQNPPQNLILRLCNRELRNGHTLLYYNIQNNAELTVVPVLANKEQLRMRYKELLKKEDSPFVDVEKSLKELSDGLNRRSDKKINTPNGMKLVLDDHQQIGLSFMAWRERQWTPGGIVADDMGMGKTIEIISLIVHQKENRLRRERKLHDRGRKKAAIKLGLIPSNTTLIVAPKSLTHHWEEEITKSVKENVLTVQIFDSKTKLRDDYQRLAQCDVLIMTYGMAKFNPILLSKIAFERVVLDEAHNIKNIETKVAMEMCKLSPGSRWCVTGTPINNSLLDLYSLIRFIRFSPFADKSYWDRFVGDKKKEDCIERLQILTKNLMIRRTKEERNPATNTLYVTLPEKIIKHHDLRMEQEENKLYETIDEAFRNRKGYSGLARTTLLLRLCDQFSLSKEGVFKEDFLKALGKKEEQIIRQSLELFQRSFKSCKLTKIMEIIADVPSGQKIVVVSKWVSFLEIIKEHLSEKEISYTTIIGKVKGKVRQDRAQNFNKNPSGPKVMLVSIRAGGVGLSLIGANHLIMADLDWNPAMEAQAFDRIYRKGQERPVYIHRLLMTGTVEENVAEKQDQKRTIAEIALSGICNTYSDEKLRMLLFADYP